MRGYPRVLKAFSLKSVLKRFHPLTVVVWLILGYGVKEVLLNQGVSIEDRVVFGIYTMLMLMLLAFFEAMREARD